MTETRSVNRWIPWIAGVLTILLGYLFFTLETTHDAGQPGSPWFLGTLLAILGAALILPAWAIFGLAEPPEA